jgi:hypothetical protein
LVLGYSRPDAFREEQEGVANSERGVDQRDSQD